MSVGHDYTKDDSPFGQEDEIVIGDVTAARSADDIEKAESFTNIPPGDHLLVIRGYGYKDKDKPMSHCTVMLNGSKTSFISAWISVRFSLADNPNCTISDLFLLPPDDPREQAAYFNGLPDGKKKAGWSASKFQHFINRIGFSWPAGSKLPADAKNLKNWKDRAVYATVELGNDYDDRDTGERKKGRNQIKSFSYRAAPGGAGQGRRPGSGGTGAGVGAGTGGHPTNGPSAASAVAGGHPANVLNNL